jgi:hypothetical protein
MTYHPDEHPMVTAYGERKRQEALAGPTPPNEDADPWSKLRALLLPLWLFLSGSFPGPSNRKRRAHAVTDKLVLLLPLALTACTIGALIELWLLW